MAYVAMPDGSSSEAPVMTPGPSSAKNRRNGPGARRSLASRTPTAVAGSIGLCWPTNRRSVADLDGFGRDVFEVGVDRLAFDLLRHGRDGLRRCGQRAVVALPVRLRRLRERHDPGIGQLRSRHVLWPHY